MPLRRTIELLVILLLLSYTGYSGTYRAINYGNEEGLPTDLTKAILQDSAGFIWIGTDAGLVRFDGIRFKLFDRDLPSPFVKRLLLTRSGELLVVTDRGIGVIENSPERILYRPILKGSSSATDSTTTYPKAIFEAADGSLWISEPGAIVHWKNQALRRYRFDERFRAEGYIRSFLVGQDDRGRLIAATEGGSFFLFDPASDAFRRLSISGVPMIAGVDAMVKLRSGKLVVGCAQGVFVLTIDGNNDAASLRRLVELPRVSSLIESPDGTLYAGTWRTGVYVIEAQSSIARQISTVRQRVVNDLSLTLSGRILVSSDEGICIAQKCMFEKVPLALANYYIQAIAGDGGNGVFVTDGQSVFHAWKRGEDLTSATVYRSSANVLVSLALGKEGLWIGCRGDLLRLVTPDGRVRNIPLPKLGSGLVSALCPDSGNGLWICRDGLEGVERLLPDGRTQEYTRSKGLFSHINILRKTAAGDIIAGGVGDSTYLYRYDRRADRFVNISVRFPEMYGLRFSVNDIVVGSGDTVLLGTNRGLYRSIAGRMEQDSVLEALHRENVKSMAIDKAGDVWLGTERGVLWYHDGEIARYDGRDGLSSMTMSYRSMYIGPDDNVWVGTANGTSCGVWNPGSAAPVRTPRILSIQADQSVFESIPSTFVLPHGVSMSVIYVSMSYPQDRILYQYRLRESNTQWSNPSHASELRLAGLDGGHYTLEVRAKREGGKWTSPAVLPFEILSPWYRSWWALCGYVALAAGLAYAVASFSKLRREKKTIEEEIRRSEKKYRTIFENVQDVFYQTDLQGTITEISPSIMRYSGLTRSRLLGQSFRDLFFTKVDWEELTKLLLAKGEVTDFEVAFTPQGRQPLFVSVNAHVVLDANDDAVGVEGSLRDITERKRAQERIESTLHEKEMLLKEIHHRVKNNMQVISSLLSLQAAEARDSATREGLIDSQNRVRSMALVHEKLYRSANMSDIDFGEYLKSVIGELARSYLRDNVSYAVEVDAIHLGIDIAIPCGLIVNELVSNAFKHAFPEGRKGTVKVTLRRKQGGGIQLRIKDDGVGIPADKDPREMTSMGMGIVFALTDQISANVAVERDDGTTFIVDFKE
ncbi:MAG: histidine kinase dimerization/phosphoacceptor domain -containing protein [Bacteroidota bacterium]